jgi:hypothetical protein
MKKDEHSHFQRESAKPKEKNELQCETSIIGT